MSASTVRQAASRGTNTQACRTKAMTWVLLGILLLGGCGNAVSTPRPAASIPATFQTVTPQPQSSKTTSPEPVARETASTHPTPAPQPCSPLAVQPLEKISEIITQPFQMPRVMDDGSYKDDGHHGLDLGYYTRDGVNFTGTPALSALEGRIAAVIHDRPPYGNAVIVETPFEQIPTHVIVAQSIPTGSSLYLLYAHLQNLRPLTIGQTIGCGEELAETGLTGFTGGPHLHLETRWGPPQESLESMAFYRADATTAELAAYERWRMSGTFVVFDPMILLSPAPGN